MHSVSAAERHLNTEHLGWDLKGRSVRGGAVTLLGQACRLILYLISTAILARMLDPKDFGLLAMVAVVTGFLAQFKDLGLSMSTVQRHEIDSVQVTALFWVNAAFGLLLGLMTVACAPLLAWFYDEPRLTPITMLLAASLVLGGLGVQHQALLRRQMRFAAIVGIEVVSMGIGAVAAITAAYAGAGYWSLVALELGIALSMLVGAWVVCDWRPARPARSADIRALLTFGGNLTASNLVHYLIRNLDNLLIGKRWGPAALGLYAKAYDLLLAPLNLINTPVATVAVPGLSRLQYDPPSFRNYYLQALSLATFLSMPVAAFLIVMADEVVALLLGPRWDEAVPIFRLLAITAMLQPVGNTAGWLYIATGRTARMLRWGLVAAAVTVSAFFLGLPYGPRGVALAYSIAVILLIWPGMRLALAGLPLTMMDIVRTIWRPAAAAGLSAAAVWAAKVWAAPQLPDWTIALLGGAGMAALYSLVLLSAPATRRMYRDVLRELVIRGPARDADV